MADWEPNIVAFCCNYCAYRAADLAGTSRMQYPLNVKIIRLPCSGKVDITYILRAFEKGADGVIVAGCLKGGCHFVEGNLRAEQRIKFTKELLNAVGFDGQRLEMFFLSSSMAPRFVEIMNEMTERIRKLGQASNKKLELTKRTPEITKREFLYEMLRNLASKKPEKPIPVPEELKEFGRIDHNLTQCIGCRRCGEVCPEKAIDFIQEFDMPKILQTVSSGGQDKVTKRLLLYETIAKIAVKPPSRAISVPEEMREFCELRYNPRKCVLCDKCANICPEKAITIVREIDLPTILS